MYRVVGLLFVLSSVFLGMAYWPRIGVYYNEYLFVKKWEQSWRQAIFCLSSQPLSADGGEAKEQKIEVSSKVQVPELVSGYCSQDDQRLGLSEEGLQLREWWRNLRSFTFHPTDWKHVFWLKWGVSPIAVSPNGNLHLDILMMSWDEGGERFVVLQYDLREIGGQQNTLWEGGQTFKFSHH